MFHHRFAIHAGAAVLFAALSCPQELRAAMPESQRMERAKDLIADEQWGRAIDELKAAAADPKETNKDEALFWLAHSQNQSRDFGGAVETIHRLERTFPASRWVKPARSLRIEIAQRLQRNDVLWWHTVPPPAPFPVEAVPPAPLPPGAGADAAATARRPAAAAAGRAPEDAAAAGHAVLRRRPSPSAPPRVPAGHDRRGRPLPLPRCRRRRRPCGCPKASFRTPICASRRSAASFAPMARR